MNTLKYSEVNRNQKTTWREVFRKDFWIFFPFALYLSNIWVLDYLNYYLILPAALFLFRQSELKLVEFKPILLFSFSCTFYFFSNRTNVGEQGILAVVRQCFYPVLFYYSGNYLTKRYPMVNSKITIIIILLVLFSAIPFFSNIFSIVTKGFMSTREVPLLVSGLNEYPIAATIMASFFAIHLSLFPFVFSYFENESEKRTIRIFRFLFFMGLMCVLNVSSRTGILIALISLLPVLFIYSLKFSTGLVTKLFLVLFVLTIVFIASGWDSYLLNSDIYLRFTDDSSEDNLTDSRFLIWEEAFDLIINSRSVDMAGDLLERARYAHNLWLDVAITAGLFPTFLLIIVTIQPMVSLFNIISNKYYTRFYRLLLTSIFLAFYSTFFVEPIMAGYFTFFCLFCFMYGFIQDQRQFQ